MGGRPIFWWLGKIKFVSSLPNRHLKMGTKDNYHCKGLGEENSNSFFFLNMSFMKAIGADRDEMLCIVASYLGLHCLLESNL